jgi:hypothetical protein
MSCSNPVHQAENCGCGADSERENRDGGGRDGRILPHDAQSVPNILKHDVIVLLGGFGQDTESRMNPNHENA